MSWTVQGLNSGRGKRFFWSPKCPDRFWGSSNLLLTGCLGSFPGQRSWGVMFITYHHLVPRSRMIGAIPLLPLYAFMVQIETA